MIQLNGVWDYVSMLLLAAVMGAVGGVVWELIQNRRRNTGTIELWGKLPGSRLFDLGGAASVIIGAVAAVIILLFFPPEVRIAVEAADGTSRTTTHYEIVKLISLSLLAGSAGSTFITAAQARIMAALSEQKAQAVSRVAQEQIKNMGEDTKAELKREFQSAIDKRLPELGELVEQAAEESSPKLMRALQKMNVLRPGKEAVVVDSDEERETIRLIPSTSPAERTNRIKQIFGGAGDEAAEAVRERIQRRVSAAEEIIKAVASSSSTSGSSPDV